MTAPYHDPESVADRFRVMARTGGLTIRTVGRRAVAIAVLTTEEVAALTTVATTCAILRCDYRWERTTDLEITVTLLLEAQ